MKKKSKNNKGMNIPIEEIDKVIHEPARMKIMANLYFVESMDAIFLLRQTNLTWGNLATHTKKLEASGYVVVKKEFILYWFNCEENSSEIQSLYGHIKNLRRKLGIKSKLIKTIAGIGYKFDDGK